MVDNKENYKFDLGVKGLINEGTCKAFCLKIDVHSYANEIYFPSASFWKWGSLELGNGLLGAYGGWKNILSFPGKKERNVFKRVSVIYERSTLKSPCKEGALLNVKHCIYF